MSNLKYYKPMARTKEFDRDKVIQAAIDVFRKQGYGRTTTEDIRLAMGIGRQSFYDSFHGKEEVYAEALNKYHSDQISKYLVLIEKDTSAIKSIESILMSIAQESLSEKKLSCLGVSSICEFGTSAGNINSANRNATSIFINLFKNLVTKAIENGEMRKSLDSVKIASFLLTVLSGLKIASRGGASKADLEHTVKIALAGLKAI